FNTISLEANIGFLYQDFGPTIFKKIADNILQFQEIIRMEGKKEINGGLLNRNLKVLQRLEEMKPKNQKPQRKNQKIGNRTIAADVFEECLPDCDEDDI